jgi:macrolide-specific efflux system membrane fusion protein
MLTKCSRLLLSLVIVAAGPALRGAEPIPVQSVLIRLIDEAEVPAREAGVLAVLSAAEGQLVAQGEELAQLDDRQAQLLHQKAQAELEVVRKEAASDVEIRTTTEAAKVAAAELRRAQEAKSRVSESVSQSELDRLGYEAQKTALDVEQARQNQEVARLKESVKQRELEIAAEHVQRHHLVAPLAGMVVKLYRHRGEWVEPGEKVLRIVRLDRLRAEGFVDAASLRGTLAGRQATVTVDLPGQPKTRFPGIVTFVNPEIDPVNGQFRIWVEVDNPKLQLQPGMRAEMTVGDNAAGMGRKP